MWWQRLRAALFVVSLVLGAAALAGVAWLTQHPDSPELERATEWPVVGGLAQSFRRAYLGEPLDPTAAPTGDEAVDIREPGVARGSVVPPSRFGETRPSSPPSVAAVPVTTPPSATGEPALGALASSLAAIRVEPGVAAPDVSFSIPALRPPPLLAEEWRWFLPGQPLSTKAAGEVVRNLEAISYLPILSRSGTWLEIRWDDQVLWLDSQWEPAHNRRKARQGGTRQRREPYRGTDWRRLDAAKEIFGLRKPVGRLGPYELWTDVKDLELLAFLDQLAGAVEPAYFSRYGRLPSGDPRRAVVLFAREADYRAFSPDSILADTHAGHAGQGLLALFVGDRARIDLARTLAHEITHLLNDRALALVLPEWLEEGMASDLGSVWVESAEVDGGGRLTGDPRQDASRSFVLLGSDFRTLRLAGAMRGNRLPDIGVFLTLPPREFYRAENIGTSYEWGATFVRYLLDGDGGRYRSNFLAYFQQIADGHDPTMMLFFESLGITDTPGLEALEANFRRWLAAESEPARARVERRTGARVVD